MTTATQKPTSPFSPAAGIAFAQYLSLEDLQRPVRPTDENRAQICQYLLETRISTSQEDRRVKFKALREYELIEGRLLTKVGLGARGAKVQRYVPRDEEVFDIVTRANLGLLHPGQLKTFQEIERTTAGISRKEVTELLKHCSTCSKKALQKSTAPIKVIVENVLWGWVQIDLIDMRGDPDEQFQWICHLRGHFSKYSVAFPMPN